MDTTKFCANPETLSEVESREENQISKSLDQELTDEQLLELAEGSCTWGTGRCD